MDEKQMRAYAAAGFLMVYGVPQTGLCDRRQLITLSVHLSLQHLRRSTYSCEIFELEFGTKFQRELPLIFQILELLSNTVYKSRACMPKTSSIRSAVSIQYWHVTDRQTHGQTDRLTDGQGNS